MPYCSGARRPAVDLRGRLDVAGALIEQACTGVLAGNRRRPIPSLLLADSPIKGTSDFQRQRHDPHAAGGADLRPPLRRHTDPLWQLCWRAALPQPLLATGVEITSGGRHLEGKAVVPQVMGDLAVGSYKRPHLPSKWAAAGSSRNSRCTGHDSGACLTRPARRAGV